MARPRFLSRSRGADAAEPRPVPVRRPAPAALRRERKLLLRLREERLRDLGGLLLEMYRRGTFREELLSERCADLVAIETRLADVDATLAAPRRGGARCACGAPLLPAARFCPSCGRQLRPAPRAAAPADETVVVARDER